MFKTNSKSNNNSNNKDRTNLVPDSSLLIKEGYITKFKSKKKRYFTLYTQNDNEPAHLDYYENEKKFRANSCSYKRSILLKDCFAVIKKNDPRFQKSGIFVFAIYTRDDCFSLMFDTESEMSSWYALINEVHLKSIAKNNMIHDYDKIWYVVIRDKKSIIKGSFYLCLTSEEIHLYKIQNLKDKKSGTSSDQPANTDQSELTSPLIDKTPMIDPANLNHTPLDKMQSFRFPFSLIRSFGHQSNYLFIQLGRSSDLGSCQLWFELKDCDTSQHIHSLVASSRTSSKSNEFRTRSNSENNRMFSRQNKSSLSDKTAVNPASISQSNTNASINQLNNSTNKSSSNSLKFNNQKAINCDNKLKNDKENSTEYISSPVYTSVACTLLANSLPIRSRSTSESSSSHAAFNSQPKVFQSLLKSRNLNSQSSNSNLLGSSVLSTESMKSKEDNDGSDYYMVTPTTRESLPSACIKEEDYLVVGGELSDSCLVETKSPTENKTFSNTSSVDIDHLGKVDNLTIVPTGHLASSKLQNSSPLSYALENAQHYKHNTQYYQPISNSFVELPDSVEEELNENGQIDEYIQVESGNLIRERKGQIAPSKTTNSNDKKSKTKLDHQVTNLESSSLENSTKLNTNNKPTERQQSISLDDDEEYIGVESISSTNTATNLESENFEMNNFSPISSTSCNMNRVKTFSTSSNNTSNNELNSLGTSPSLLSNAFYNTPVNHNKEETFKLDKVKSYFNSTEDCDYIKPARTYSMGSRPQLNYSKLKHMNCSMTKSNTSNTISNNLLNKKVQCGGHLIDPACIHLDEAFVKDNRVRAYSMGSHSTVKKDLLRKIKLSHLQKRQDSTKQSTLDGSENNEQNEKCLSTPMLISKDICTARNRSATFTSTLNSSASSSSKKTVNEESSEEDDLMTIDFDRLENSVPRIENHDYMDGFSGFDHNQISIKDKFKELSLDTGELKTKE